MLDECSGYVKVDTSYPSEISLMFYKGTDSSLTALVEDLARKGYIESRVKTGKKVFGNTKSEMTLFQSTLSGDILKFT